ncbi:hypothetical protein [Paenibacillus ihumii]|uniref:hypothetical protein n=1 Tax=Paenibacillus ihumii TaxID=687436 RepID=UPI000A8933E9|nr:hypothetical protein [Paenibacillus ihumii]
MRWNKRPRYLSIQTLSFGGGIDVIPTPGHTPGHMSFYHRPSRTPIALAAAVQR